MSQTSIFITIPAYEDPQLFSTIDGAINNATFPDSLHFAVGLQYKNIPDLSRYRNNPRIKFLFYDVDKRPGVYQIRRELAELYSGQDYFLMIDSHMVFDVGWDAKLINSYKTLQMMHGSRVIISRASPRKTGQCLLDTNLHEGVRWIVNTSYLNDLQKTIIPLVEPMSWNGDMFVRSFYACNHFFFTSGKFLLEVGFQKNVRFYCEEHLTSIDAFLSGWDIYFDPTYILIGHNDVDTTRFLYGKDYHTILDGKKFTAIEDTDQMKLEINRYLLTGKSTELSIKNSDTSRSIDEYYSLSNLTKERDMLIDLLLNNNS